MATNHKSPDRELIRDLIKVKLIRRESRWIIIRREYKVEDLFIIFRPEVVTANTI